MSYDYESELRTARKVGASNCSDAGLMAVFCDSTLQLLAGAVSPRLVFEAAQKRGITALELSRLACTNPAAIHEMMWE